MIKRFNRVIATLLVIVVIGTLLEQRHLALAVGNSPENRITIIVRSSPNSELVSRLDIDSSEMTKAFMRAKKEKIDDVSFIKDIYITSLEGKQDKAYRLEQSGNLWDASLLKRLVLPRRIARKLLSYAYALRKEHYGQMISWERAERILPRKSIFFITDLETGLTFRVQRRAGSDHADVQPLTKTDTKIMKQIYHGQWSWKRKAILVHSGHEWLAASMNGMPHGGDGIPNNGFSGHFCVHFFNSTTHRSKDPDLAHQLMVHKSAGNLRSFLDSASPLMIAESFIVAMNQQDSQMLSLVSEGLEKEKYDNFVKEMNALMSIQIEKPRRSENKNLLNDSDWGESLSAEVKLQITIHKKGDSKRKAAYLFTFRRTSKDLPWRVENVLTNPTKD